MLNSFLEVWSNSPAKGNDLLMLLVIADAADDELMGTLPFWEDLAKKTRLRTKEQVEQRLTRLREKGYLKLLRGEQFLIVATWEPGGSR